MRAGEGQKEDVLSGFFYVHGELYRELHGFGPKYTQIHPLEMLTNVRKPYI